MDRERIKKYSLRMRNAEWAVGYLRRATEDGSMHRMRRAIYLTQALNGWLLENAPTWAEPNSDD